MTGSPRGACLSTTPPRRFRVRRWRRCRDRWQPQPRPPPPPPYWKRKSSGSSRGFLFTVRTAVLLRHHHSPPHPNADAEDDRHPCKQSMLVCCGGPSLKQRLRPMTRKRPLSQWLPACGRSQVVTTGQQRRRMHLTYSIVSLPLLLFSSTGSSS